MNHEATKDTNNVRYEAVALPRAASSVRPVCGHHERRGVHSFFTPVAPSGKNIRTRMNHLYYGDNLDILTRYIADESVDLVYLDPPFNSAQNYNAFFQEKDGTAAAAQIQAFEDTWEWNEDSRTAYDALSLRSDKLGSVMRAFMEFLGTNDMKAYLAMMAPRLVALRRALKPSGSLYLHCDPTALP
ncbi:MAG: hypothetical protein ABMA26_27290 [Limisphaerales bacterium]